MPDAVSEARIYARTNDVVSAEVSDSVILLNTKNWVYYEFDKVGTSIWELLETPHSLPSLVQELMQKFNVDEAQCTSDTRSFLSEMIEEGIVAESGQL